MLPLQTHSLYSPSMVPFSIADLTVDEYYIGKTRLTVTDNTKLVNKRKMSRLKLTVCLHIMPSGIKFPF